MQHIPPIKAVMTAFPHSIDTAATLARARSLMIERGIRHLPVVEEGRLVGMLTDRQIERAIAASSGGDAESRLTVADACTRNVHAVGPAEPLDNVLLRMAEVHADFALVVRDDRLLGIFTATDACREFGKLLRSLFPRPDGEDAA